MFNTKPKPVPENEAQGEIERVYHEIRQCLRVTGVNLNFRTLAHFDKFLPPAWDVMRPIVITREFDRQSDSVRDEAAKSAQKLGGEAFPVVTTGESQNYQIGKVLELYHYINPKLLIFVALLKSALKKDTQPHPEVRQSPSPLPLGEPAGMYPMEMEDEEPANDRLKGIFEDIKSTLSLSRVNSDYRSLALWPEFLDRAWSWLKPMTQNAAFLQAADALRDHALALTQSLPLPGISREIVQGLGEDPEKIYETLSKFEQLLPSLILNVALLHHGWNEAKSEPRPAPASVKDISDWRRFQKEQKVVELGDRFVSYLEAGAGEPVVLIHGIPSWGYLWHNTIQQLSFSHRVIVPDLIGFGYSDKRDCFDRSIAAQAEMIQAFLKKLGLESAHIVAHDIGGGVALRLATLFPSLVRSLAVMNTVCYDSWPIELMLQMGHPSARKKLSASATKTMMHQALKMGFHSTPPAEFFEGLLSPWRTEVGKVSLIRNAAALNTNLTTELTHLLPSISVPTLVLWGEDDKFQLIEFGERLHRDIPGSQFVRVRDARHFVMIDQPEEVNAALSELLGSTVGHKTTS